MKRTFKNVKPGQKVWSLKLGKGTVSELGVNTFCVEFSRSSRFTHIHYTYNGKTHVTDKTPDLYWDKPVIIRKARLNELTGQASSVATLKGKKELKKGGVNV